ncbi:hypothetical protein D3C84_1135970 [compost metagenome]
MHGRLSGILMKVVRYNHTHEKQNMVTYSDNHKRDRSNYDFSHTYPFSSRRTIFSDHSVLIICKYTEYL